MKRDDIALLTRARHDLDARREVGRRYLAGTEGFPRHEQLALEYLTHPGLLASSDSACIICDHLDLARIVELGHETTLRRAAEAGSAEAQFKLAVWTALLGPDAPSALRWLKKAVRQGHAAAGAADAALQARPRSRLDEQLLQVFRAVGADCFDTVAPAAAARLAERNNVPRLLTCLRVALDSPDARLLPLARCLKPAIHAAIDGRCDLSLLPVRQVEACLEALASDGDAEATHWLGCACAGIGLGALPWSRLVGSGNLRKGVALLMRAADAGNAGAWMQLYRTHANHRCSVANPQLARYFLEKAAMARDVEAQRRLGALMLRSSTSLKESELAVAWLHAAFSAGDAPAGQLLRTLVLPLDGTEAEAAAALALVRAVDPWLAARLQLSRDFGLTKLEALCVDPVEGQRPWGLVVGRNPFVLLPRLSGPRAVPAVDDRVLDGLRRVVLMFEGAARDGGVVEGDHRVRSARQRRLFARFGIREPLFFATANARTLDALRSGPKWVLRARSTFDLALAC